MTNLKKTLAVVLAFAMVLSMGAISTFAYSDVADGTVVSEAVGILSNLNILTGFEDGTFKPDETVTRAQMAAIICRTLGYEDQAKSSMGSTVFNDVAADHWASGYINVAQAQQIINGYGNGNYGPEDLVTYEQAVKMIVSALGYDLAAQGKGGYPTGYLAVASAEGITKNANGRVGDAAKRGTIAVLVYNSLEVRLMDQNSWSTDGTDTYGKQDANVLSKYLDVKKYEGIVTATPVTKTADTHTYDPKASKDITISNAECWDFARTTGTDYSYQKVSVGTAIADCTLVEDIDKFIGKKVVAYIGEDDVLGDRTLFAITEAKNQNSSTVVTGDQLADANYNEYNTVGQVSYKPAGSNRYSDASLQLDNSGNTKVDVYVNYDKQTADTAISTATIAALCTAGKVELISNDYDSDIEVILVTSYTSESVIEEVTVEDGVYTFECYTNGIDEIDPEDDKVNVTVYVDGQLADAAALKAGYTVSTVDVTGNGKYLVHYASSKTVTGAVESRNETRGEESVTIGGEEYEISPSANITVSSLKDQEGTFFINVDGKIAHNETETTGNANYGVAILAGQESGINNPYVVSVAHTDGTVVDYELSDKAQYVLANGTALTVPSGSTGAKVTAEKIASIMNGGTAVTLTQGNSKFATRANVADLVFKFTVKNDKITRVAELKNASANYSNNKSYDAESMSYGSAQFDDSTIVMNIKKAANDTTQIKAEDITVGKVASYFVDGDSYEFVTKDVEKDIAPLVIGYNLTPSIPQDSAVIFVTATSKVTYDDDDALQIKGFQAGKEVSFILYDDTKTFTVNKGDIILAATPDSDNVANDCEVLYSKATGALAAGVINGNYKDDIYNAFGNLDANATTNSKFFLDVDVKNLDTTVTPNRDNVLYAAADGIPVRNGANYTLVDYTESSTKPEVTKKNPGTTLFSKNAKYTSKVFVRVYDGKLTDVVVMRFNAPASSGSSN